MPAHTAPDQAVVTPPRWPPLLRAGDQVALFSPASHGGKNHKTGIEAAIQCLTAQGLRVHLDPTTDTDHPYLAGSDQNRAQAFEKLYLHPQLRALFATRGGYGSARILPLLNLNALKHAPPKMVIGMSDVSALLTVLQQILQTVVCHGPCIASPDFIESDTRELNLNALFQALMTPHYSSQLSAQILHWPQHVPAQISGSLGGGCLSVLAASMGTPWALDRNTEMLFIEDVGERPYRLDRYLTQLHHAGTMDNLRAVLIGRLHRCSDQESETDLQAMLSAWFSEAPYPVIWHIPAGHGGENHPLPLGGQICLKKEQNSVTLSWNWNWA